MSILKLNPMAFQCLHRRNRGRSTLSITKTPGLSCLRCFPRTPSRSARNVSLRSRFSRFGLIRCGATGLEADRVGSGVEVVRRERLAVERVRKVEGKVTVKLSCREVDGRLKGELVVGCDVEGKWLLHWGITYFDEFGSEWDQPPFEMRPVGSLPIKDYAVETPLKKSSIVSERQLLYKVRIDLDCSNSVASINFVLKDEETGSWHQHRGREDFEIPLYDSLPRNGATVDGIEGFSILPGALDQLSNSLLDFDGSSTKLHENGCVHKNIDHVNRLIEGYCKEYPILKEEHVQNYVTATIIKKKRNYLVLDTDIPGNVVVHWGVCRNNGRVWEIPATQPPRSKVFRNKALRTLLQQKVDVVGSWGLFPLDKDVTGVPFVLKIDEYTWLDNMSNDFYVPLSSNAPPQSQNDYCTEDLKLTTDLQDLLDDLARQSVSPLVEWELLTEFAAQKNEPNSPNLETRRKDSIEMQDRDSSVSTDEIINEIRHIVTDISAEKGMTATTREVQGNILEEIEKLAAEAYSIFRSSAPIFVEEPVPETEPLKPPVHISSGTGSGYEILCQGFNWESNKSGNWYGEMCIKASELSKLGFTVVWLPPPTQSVSPEGYMPSDLYDLNSRYGSMEELKNLIDELHEVGIKVLGDVVLNHRCAHYQNKYGIWNIFGGHLNWDDRAIVADDPHFQGKGNKSSGDNFHAAPNIDHSQDFVRRDLNEWLCWLRSEIGYDGWRLDFVRGFWGGYVKDYLEASEPYFSVGEYWDSLSYTYGEMDHNQDAHRQRIIDWINATNGTSGAFDVTTKGILHAALEKYEYWRLSDEKGKPPGVVGWWPSRAVTFIENHDTGSTQGHWRFPAGKEMQGYAYILTHPGTPSVFYDHIYSHYQHEISTLISLRNRTKLHCRSMVNIMKAERDVYAAEIDEKVAMKIGPGYYEPAGPQRWVLAAEGRDYKIWESQ